MQEHSNILGSERKKERFRPRAVPAQTEFSTWELRRRPVHRDSRSLLREKLTPGLLQYYFRKMSKAWLVTPSKSSRSQVARWYFRNN